MQGLKASRFRIFGFALLGAALISSYAFFKFFGSGDENQMVNAAEIQLPSAAHVERFNFEQKGTEGWETVDGQWAVEDMLEAPGGKTGFDAST